MNNEFTIKNICNLYVYIESIITIMKMFETLSYTEYICLGKAVTLFKDLISDIIYVNIFW